MHFETCSGDWRAQGILQVFRVFLYFSRYFQCTGTFCKIFFIVFISSNPGKKWFWRSWNSKGRRIFTRLCDFLENWNYGWWIFPSLSPSFFSFEDSPIDTPSWQSRPPGNHPPRFFSYKSLRFWSETCTLYVVLSACMIHPTHINQKRSSLYSNMSTFKLNLNTHEWFWQGVLFKYHFNNIKKIEE